MKCIPAILAAALFAVTLGGPAYAQSDSGATTPAANDQHQGTPANQVKPPTDVKQQVEDAVTKELKSAGAKDLKSVGAKAFEKVKSLGHHHRKKPKKVPAQQQTGKNEASPA